MRLVVYFHVSDGGGGYGTVRLENSVVNDGFAAGKGPWYIVA